MEGLLDSSICMFVIIFGMHKYELVESDKMTLM